MLGLEILESGKRYLHEFRVLEEESRRDELQRLRCRHVREQGPQAPLIGRRLHLASRIPFYRLHDVVKDHDALAQTRRITLWESFRCARLHLWDEKSRRLLSFAEARALPV